MTTLTRALGVVRLGALIYPLAWWHPEDGKIADEISFDTETTEIPGDRSLPTFIIGSAFDGRRAFLIRREDLAAFVAAHAAGRWVLHHAAFDLAVIEKAGAPSLLSAVEDGRVHDKGIMERLLNLATGGSPGDWALDKLALKYLIAVVPKPENIRLGFGDFLCADGSIDYGRMSPEHLEYSARARSRPS